MNKALFHKSFSALMASVVLLSTMSFSLSMHFCGDVLVDRAIFSKSETCGMEISTENPANKTNCSVNKKDCCSDQVQTIAGQNKLPSPVNGFSLSDFTSSVAFIHVIVLLFESAVTTKIAFKEFPPPFIVRHIFKLDETYLI